MLQGSKNQNFKLIGFQNSLVQDVHFIKVMGKYIQAIYSLDSIVLFPSSYQYVFLRDMFTSKETGKFEEEMI